MSALLYCGATEMDNSELIIIVLVNDHINSQGLKTLPRGNLSLKGKRFYLFFVWDVEWETVCEGIWVCDSY